MILKKALLSLLFLRIFLLELLFVLDYMMTRSINDLTGKMRMIFPLGLLLVCGMLGGISCGEVKIPWYMVPPAAPLLIVPEDYSLLPPEIVQDVQKQGNLTVSFPNALPGIALQARNVLWGIVFEESSQKGQLSRAQMRWLSRSGRTQPGIRSLLFKKPFVSNVSQSVVSKKHVSKEETSKKNSQDVSKRVPLPKKTK